MRATDLTGMRFGLLTAVEQVASEPRGKRRNAMWRCVCDCGNDKIVLAQKLLDCRLKSCGHTRSRLTEAQRQELLTAYLANGFTATKPMAIAYGIAPRYLARLARRAGHTHNYPRTRAAPKSKYKDPRWQRAIANGAVIA